MSIYILNTQCHCFHFYFTATTRTSKDCIKCNSAYSGALTVKHCSVFQLSEYGLQYPFYSCGCETL